MSLRSLIVAALAFIAPGAPAFAQDVLCSDLNGAAEKRCKAIIQSNATGCSFALQGKIPWNRAGNTRYADSTLRQICRDVAQVQRHIDCYKAHVEVGVNYAHAADLCRGFTQGMAVHLKGEGPKARTFETSAPRRSVENDIICTTDSASIGDSFEKNFILREAAQNSSIAPGMVFFLNDLQKGSLTALGGPGQDRLPVPIFANFYDSPNVSTDAMLEPGADRGLSRDVDGDRLLSNVSAAIREMMGRNPSVRVLGSNFQVSEVHSNLHLSLALKGAFSNSTTKLKGSFDFDKTSKKSRVVAQFVNSYYGVHVDYTALPQGMEGWFKPEVIADIDAQINHRGPLVFVDSVVYGRAAYFVAEAEASELELKNTLNAAYSAGTLKVEGDEKGEMNKTLASSNLQATFMGDFGNGGRTPRDIDGFIDVLEADRSPNDLGVPVAYTLRFVENNQAAATHVMTEITDRTCRPLKSKVSFDLDKIEVILSSDEGGADTEIRGGGTVYVEYDDPSTGKVVKLDPIGAATTAPLPGFDEKLLRLQEQAGLDVKHFFFSIQNIKLAENLPEHYPPAAPIFVEIGQSYEFEIPDAPETPEVNEVKTARIIVKWGDIIEDDGDKFANGDDRMEGKSPSDTSRRFTVTQYEGMSDNRKTFHFRGDPDKDYVDAEFKIHFSLDTFD